MRQYIGARYVPKFMGTYDVTQVYEALSVVDNGMGTSYISKIPTPAGTPLTDGTYWALYGASSGAIISLQEQIDDMQDGTVPGSLQNQINKNTADITNLDIANKTVLFVSDSYGAATNSFIDQCASTLGITDYHNLAVSGTSFKDGGFLAQISGYTGDKSEVELIVVAGGLNDADLETIDSALTTAMTTFNNYVIANYPNAKVLLCYIGNGFDNSALLAGRTLNKRLWTSYQYQLFAESNGWAFDDISDSLKVVSGVMNSDGVHPNTYGQSALAASLCSVILTGSHSVQYPPYPVAPTFTSPWTAIGTLNFKFKVKDSLVTIQSPTDLYLNYAGDITGGQVVQIATLGSLFFNKKYVIKDVNCRLDGSTNGLFYNTTADIIFENDTMSIMFTEVNAGHNGFLNFTRNGGDLQLTVGVNQFVFNLCDMG